MESPTLGNAWSFLSSGLLWYSVSLLPAFAAWPLAAAAAPRSFSWGMARIVALPLWGWLLCLPAVFGKASLTSPILGGVLLGLAVLTWTGRTLARRSSRFSSAAGDVPSLQDMLAFEAVLFVAVVLFSLFAPFMATLTGLGERMRDAALLSSVLREHTFPFQDPWFAGTDVVYYVFGYVTHALLPTVLGVWKPTEAYQVGLIATGSLYVGALAVLFRAAGLGRTASAAGAFVVALGGNLATGLEGLRTLFQSQIYNWWEPSRVIENTITEFPGWTATFGDLHPHFLGMFLWPLALALSVGAVRREAPSRVAAFCLVALAAAWQQGTNAWETPLFLAVLVAAALFVSQGTRVRDRALFLGGLLALFACAVAPFVLHAAKVSRSFGFVSERSDALQWLSHWGLWLVPLFCVGFPGIRRSIGRDMAWGAIALVAVGALLRSGFVLAAACCVFAVGASWVAARSQPTPDTRSVATWLAAVGFGICLLCELVHLKDVYGDKLARLNTVFKFYVPAWTALGVAAVLAVGIAKDAYPRFPRRIGQAFLLAWLVLLAMHPTLGVWTRGNRFQVADHLDGLDGLRREMPDDIRLGEWILEEQKSGRDFDGFAEAPGGAYSSYMRLSTMTGLASPFAWDGYGYWSIQGLDTEARRRLAAVKEAFTAEGDCDVVRGRFLKLGVRFVAVGTAERRQFGEEAALRLSSCLSSERAEGTSSLLGVVPSSPAPRDVSTETSM